MILRILMLPFGLIYKLLQLSLDGSRDLVNKLKYRTALINKGCCIANNCHISNNVHIFDYTILINTKIDAYTYIQKNSLIQNATIGKYCSIANDVIIGLGKHPLYSFSTSPLFFRIKNPLNYSFVEKDSNFIEYQPIEIGNDVWIGARVIIMDGVKIGNGAVVGANSVVTKDVPDYAIVVGSPAKIIKYRFEESEKNVLLKSEWWNFNHSDLLEFFNTYTN